MTFAWSKRAEAAPAFRELPASCQPCGRAPAPCSTAVLGRSWGVPALLGACSQVLDRARSRAAWHPPERGFTLRCVPGCRAGDGDSHRWDLLWSSPRSGLEAVHTQPHLPFTAKSSCLHVALGVHGCAGVLHPREGSPAHPALCCRAPARLSPLHPRTHSHMQGHSPGSFTPKLYSCGTFTARIGITRQ